MHGIVQIYVHVSILSKINLVIEKQYKGETPREQGILLMKSK